MTSRLDTRPCSCGPPKYFEASRTMSSGDMPSMATTRLPRSSATSCLARTDVSPSANHSKRTGALFR
jgi:hypothetical protein